MPNIPIKEKTKDLLLLFLLRLNDKGLIDNHFPYEAEIRNFFKTKEAKKIIDVKENCNRK